MKNRVSPAMNRYNNLIGEINAAYHDAALRLGISDSALQILYTVCCSGESCLLSEICRRSGLSKQTVNSALRKLEEEGAVRLEAAGARAKAVCLTAAGKRLAQRTALPVIEIENGIFDSWAQEDVQKYLALTERFLIALKERAGALPGPREGCAFAPARTAD